MIMLSGRGLRSSVRRAYARCKPAAWRTTQEAYLLAGHDDLLIENLGLSTDSVVIEVGGYQGAYVAAIIERYGCTVHVFEPVDDFYAQLCQRFGTDPRIRLHPYGLDAVDATTTFQLAADATGGSSSGGRTVPVQLRAVATVINELPPSVDVMTINIEGAEYEVLRAMAEAGILSRVQRLHVQFHDVGTSTSTSLEECRALLSATHQQAWCFDMVWECWQRTPDAPLREIGAKSVVGQDDL